MKSSVNDTHREVTFCVGFQRPNQFSSGRNNFNRESRIEVRAFNGSVYSLEVFGSFDLLAIDHSAGCRAVADTHGVSTPRKQTI